MATPNRFQEGHEVSLERLLLDAGRAERPGRKAKRRAAMALGLGGLGWFAPSSTASAALKAVKAGVAGGGKWLVVGAVGGGAIATAHYASFSGSEAAAPAPALSASARLAASAPAARSGRSSEGVATAEAEPGSENPAAELPAVEVPAADGPTPSPSKAERQSPEDRSPGAATSQRAAGAPTASIADQIRRLDRVRSALASGQSPQALAQLREFRTKYPATPFGQEATVLGIEALVGVGQVGKARALAQQFERSNPRSPHLKRLRELVGERDGR